MNEISLCAYAKLNLYLDITGKRNDGYHLLETVMQSIDLCDIVTIRMSDKVARRRLDAPTRGYPTVRKTYALRRQITSIQPREDIPQARYLSKSGCRARREWAAAARTRRQS